MKKIIPLVLLLLLADCARKVTYIILPQNNQQDIVSSYYRGLIEGQKLKYVE